MQRFTGLEYLKIDIANNFGLDKKLWSERIAFVDENIDHLETLIADAETPALYYASVKALRDAQSGKPSGFPVSLDATSSGFQILAALTCDRSAALISNVVDCGYRADAYTIVYKTMVDLLQEEGKISRNDCKKAVMTALYGSKAVPKRVFGEGQLLQVFFDTMAEIAPAAWELNEHFLEIWNPEALKNSWVLPDNFHVHVKVMGEVSEKVFLFNEPFEVKRKVNMAQDEGRSLGANTIHSIDGMIVREMVRRCNYDQREILRVERVLNGANILGSEADVRMAKILWDLYLQSGYLSARILDHVYANTLIDGMLGPIRELVDSLPEKPFEVIAVHDCFRCLPNYGNDLREQYNRQLYLIAKSEMLSFLLSQLCGRKIEVGKLNPEMIDEIMDAEYALS